jgi:hypothetical protein
MLKNQSDVSGMSDVDNVKDIKIQFKRKAKSEFFGSQKNHI